MRALLDSGQLEERQIEIEVTDDRSGMGMMPGMEEMGLNLQEMFSGVMPKKRRRRKVNVREARRVLANEEADKLIDHDAIGE